MELTSVIIGWIALTVLSRCNTGALGVHVGVAKGLKFETRYSKGQTFILYNFELKIYKGQVRL